MTVLRRLDPWLWPLLLMGVIFFFSAQPNLNSHLGTIDLVGRKLFHFSEYALLCALWWRVFSTRLSPARAAVLALLLASAFAITDEFHQTFVDGRHGSPVDWLIDTLGASLAAVLLATQTRARVS